MSDAELRGGPAVRGVSATRRCEDCDGDGRERMPCGVGDDACEFCGGTGRVARDGAPDAPGPAAGGGEGGR
jgi:DnaJ-class molecular chaperone